MSSFRERTEEARRFAEELFSAVGDMGFAVAVNGTEHTHPDFVASLCRSKDPTSLAIRFQPDGVARIGKTPRSFYIEAKSSETIERNAYDQYMRLHNNGCVVVVVFETSGGWGWCFIEDLSLEEAIVTVARYPPKRRFPIEDGWLAPRQAGRRPKNGSGTPYRYVLTDDLLPWSEFKERVIDRLANEEMTCERS
jgi:hypothetical protein